MPVRDILQLQAASLLRFRCRWYRSQSQPDSQTLSLNCLFATNLQGIFQPTSIALPAGYCKARLNRSAWSSLTGSSRSEVLLRRILSRLTRTDVLQFLKFFHLLLSFRGFSLTPVEPSQFEMSLCGKIRILLDGEKLQPSLLRSGRIGIEKCRFAQ
jgi:hypothetical protein